MSTRATTPWDVLDDERLRALVRKGEMTHREIGDVMGRSEFAVRARIRKIGLAKDVVSIETRKKQMADHLANGSTVVEAGMKMGIPVGYARDLFTRIRRDLGWQAQ